MSERTVFSWLFVVVAVATAGGAWQRAQAVPVGTAFTHQGRLTDSGVPANDTYDLQFKLFDAASSGTQIGSPVTKDNVSVANGLFTVQLDFGGGLFDGNARWLELGVRPGVSTGAFQMLSPRQALNAAPYALFSAAPWVTNGSNISHANGNVGIGTLTPGNRLDVVAASKGDGVRLGGTGVNDPGYHLFDGSNLRASLGLALETGSFSTSAAPGDIVLRSNTGKLLLQNGILQAGLAINGNNVGIGTTTPGARLTVQGGGSIIAFEAIGSGGLGLNVLDDGRVQIGALHTPSSRHACLSDFLTFAGCSSAAEYVPTVDDGRGHPDAGDLVGIAPTLKNPYADDHSPFVVAKSSTPCDDNLLGFVVNPESGADGKKLNDHYLPLAIYGYFPAKVTLENGPIKRGDAITSSSKPGYGMKATGACKIIGYALEDADHEGTIQVFAHHGENAAPEVAALRTQVQELRQANAVLAARLQTLEEPNAALEARLTALEQEMHGHSQVGQASLWSLPATAHRGTR